MQSNARVSTTVGARTKVPRGNATDDGYKLVRLYNIYLKRLFIMKKAKIFLAALVTVVGIEIGSGLITTVQAYSDGLHNYTNIIMEA